MSAETPAATTPNIPTTNMNNSNPSNTSGISGVGAATGTVRDLNAHEWSQAVIDELRHIQVATPPMKDADPIRPSEGHMRTSPPGRFAQESSELTPKQQSGYNQRDLGRLQAPQRPQAGTMDSAATVDIVKQIPGGW